MKFQLRRFVAAVPWAEIVFALAALLAVMVLLYTIEHRSKSKKPRCPTCNQIVKEATK